MKFGSRSSEQAHLHAPALHHFAPSDALRPVCAAAIPQVMCTSCLCTGKKLATEHDPRVDPFTLVSCVCVCVCVDRQVGCLGWLV